MSVEDLISDDDTVIAMTNLGYTSRDCPWTISRARTAAARGSEGMQTIDEDFIEDLHDHEPSLHHVLYDHGTLLPDQGVRDPSRQEEQPAKSTIVNLYSFRQEKRSGGDPDA